jgi:hypothetical protein
MVCKQSKSMPDSIKTLKDAEMKELVGLCQSLRQIYVILNSVARIVPSYGSKELYVLKRLEAFVNDELSY